MSHLKRYLKKMAKKINILQTFYRSTKCFTTKCLKCDLILGIRFQTLKKKVHLTKYNIILTMFKNKSFNCFDFY